MPREPRGFHLALRFFSSFRRELCVIDACATFENSFFFFKGINRLSPARKEYDFPIKDTPRALAELKYKELIMNFNLNLKY